MKNIYTFCSKAPSGLVSDLRVAISLSGQNS